MINIEKLKTHIPESVFTDLPIVMENYKIDNILRLSHFLGQCSIESMYFTRTVENLNYSADNLWKTFKKHFKSLEECKKYEHQPERIGNRVYADRMDNGDESTGDGYYRRGRGYIQITGTENQKDFFKSINVPEISDPKLISDVYPLISAAWFWTNYGLNKVADKGIDFSTICIVTEDINGGRNELGDRIAKTNYFYTLLTEDNDNI